MYVRREGEQIECIVLTQRPLNARRVGSWVAKSSEEALREIHKAPLLALLGLGDKTVDAEQGILPTESCIDEVCAIVGQSTFLPKLFSDALARLKDGVKAIVLEKLSSTIANDVLMNATLRKNRTKPIRTIFSLA